MFEKKYIRYWSMLLLSLFFFIIGIKTNQAAGGAITVILLVASTKQCDNKILQLVSRVLLVLVTLITVYRTFFI